MQREQHLIDDAVDGGRGPGHVRNFAKSRGRLAKTDKLDARLLAEFGEVNKPRMTRALSDVEGRLRAAVQRRDQVADLRQLAKQHVEHTDDPTMLREAKKLVATLHDEVRKLDAIVAKILKDDAVLKARATRMRTMPGIGPIIAAALLVYLPELGSISKGQVAALAGLAPMNCDSGMVRGQRHIRGGRFRVRGRQPVTRDGCRDRRPSIRTDRRPQVLPAGFASLESAARPRSPSGGDVPPSPSRASSGS